MDIPAILDYIRPNAKWRVAETYEDLVRTWGEDPESLPTRQEIEDAWPTVKASIEAMRAERADIAAGKMLVVVSPNGTRFGIRVSDVGVITTRKL